MTIPVVSDQIFTGGARITGLPVANAPGQPLTYEQLGAATPIESATLNIPIESTSHEQTVERPGTMATQSAKAWLAATPADHENQPVWLEGVTVQAECVVDSIVFSLFCQCREKGKIEINYQVT